MYVVCLETFILLCIRASFFPLVILLIRGIKMHKRLTLSQVDDDNVLKTMMGMHHTIDVGYMSPRYPHQGQKCTPTGGGLGELLGGGNGSRVPH